MFITIESKSVQFALLVIRSSIKHQLIPKLVFMRSIEHLVEWTFMLIPNGFLIVSTAAPILIIQVIMGSPMVVKLLNELVRATSQTSPSFYF